MSPRPLHLLFLCTGNSARSILAESLANHLGEGRLRAWSAGSHPKGEVHPLTLAWLRERGLDSAGLGSKSWDAFAGPQAPRLDAVITVCDRAAGESCPIWPGHPVTAHWGVDDPAAAAGDEETRRRAFARAADALERRIRALLRLPLETLDAETLRTRLREIAAAAEDEDRGKN